MVLMPDAVRHKVVPLFSRRDAKCDVLIILFNDLATLFIITNVKVMVVLCEEYVAACADE